MLCDFFLSIVMNIILRYKNRNRSLLISKNKNQNFWKVTLYTKPSVSVSIRIWVNKDNTSHLK